MKKIYGIFIGALHLVPLLSMEPDTTDLLPLMKTLYAETRSFIKEEIKTKDLLAHTAYDNEKIMKKNIQLIDLVKTIRNTAKGNLLAQDMETFAYNEVAVRFEDDVQLYVPLFFNYVRQYNGVIEERKESLPDIRKNRIDFFNTKLSQAIAEKEGTQPQQSINNYCSVKDALQYYPVYRMFAKRVSKLIHEQSFALNKDFITSLYWQEYEFPEDGYSLLSFDDFVSQFYDQAATLFTTRFIDIHRPETFSFLILDIVRILKKEKRWSAANAKELGYHIFEFEPPQSIIQVISDFLNFLISIPSAPKEWHQDPATMNIKGRIGLFCLMLQKFNDARKEKKIPAYTQHTYYRLKKRLFLCDDNNKVFDENMYAFKELDALIADFQLLKNADIENIRTSVSKHYFGGHII